MNKRQFMLSGGVAGLATATTVLAHAAPAASRASPGLLTVAGAISASNRGPLDPTFDRFMAKQGATFDKARAFDFAMLSRLPAVSIQPTLEYDGKVHKLSGPLLSSVIEAAGVAPGASVMLAMRALDGYTVAVSLADARRYRMIVATTMDGAPMNLGGMGPLWAVYDADRLPDFKDKPLKERFGLCPWAVYYIEVKAV